jgi:hypothetical protein
VRGTWHGVCIVLNQLRFGWNMDLDDRGAGMALLPEQAIAGTLATEDNVTCFRRFLF